MLTKRSTRQEYSLLLFFFSSRRRHTRSLRDWSSDVCSSDLEVLELKRSLGGKISLFSRPQKDGLARAYAAGFKEALRCGHDVIIQMDADLSHDPTYLPEFLRLIDSYDLVLGSRYVRGVNVVNWDFKRLILSKMASVYVRRVTGLPFSDLTGGYKCWRRTALEKIDLDRIF